MNKAALLSINDTMYCFLNFKLAQYIVYNLLSETVHYNFNIDLTEK